MSAPIKHDQLLFEMTGEKQTYLILDGERQGPKKISLSLESENKEDGQ